MPEVRTEQFPQFIIKHFASHVASPRNLLEKTFNPTDSIYLDASDSRDERCPKQSAVSRTSEARRKQTSAVIWRTTGIIPSGRSPIQETGWQRVPFGAPCNICEPGQEYAQLRRYNADGSGMEVVARGVRNTVGFDWHPVTKELWFTDHGRDWMGDDGPKDELNRMTKTGLNFGFPYCHAKGIADPDVKKANACDGVTMPVTTVGPHAAAMGIHFYNGRMFPAKFRNIAFIARKGSWNRIKNSGFDVVMVQAGADGKNVKTTPFMAGFLDEKADTFWGRPAYISQMKNGSLLVSDKQLGAIDRISYAKR